MKTKNILRTALTLAFSMIMLTAFAQTNDTEVKWYRWKGMKTEPQMGYYVLKSGRKMVGKIFLKGSSDHVDSFWFLDDRREIEIPHGSISSYGLSGFPGAQIGGVSVLPVADCDDSFFPYSMSSSSSGGVVVQGTKPANGYVIPHGGNKIIGELKLFYHNDVLHEFVIKNDAGTQKFPMLEIAHYGLILTIADLTNNGKKKYNDEGRNFFPGSVVMTDGTVKEGFVAFYKTGYLDGDMRYGKYYKNPFFTPTREGTIEFLADDEILKVTQEINGVQIAYNPFGDGFVGSSALTDLPFKDETRKLQPGEVTMADGTVFKGQVLLLRQELNWFYYSIFFKDTEGNIRYLSPMDVDRCTQTIDGKSTGYISYMGSFIELMFDGKNFQLFRNPFPTTVNKFLTTVSKATTNVAAGVVQNNLIEKTVPEDLTKSERSALCSEVYGQVKNMSIDQLQAFMKDCGNAKGPYGSPQNKLLDQYMGIAAAELVIRAAEDTEIKKKEWIFLNMKSHEQTIVTRGDYKNQVEPLLASCEKYLMMEKKEQNAINNFDVIEQAIKLVDVCYGE
jgi:hypothetical protein